MGTIFKKKQEKKIYRIENKSMMERCRPENFYTTTAKNHLSCAKQRGRYYYIYRHYITRQTMNTQHTHITIYIAHTQRKWMEDLYLQQQEIRRPQKGCESCLESSYRSRQSERSSGKDEQRIWIYTHIHC